MMNYYLEEMKSNLRRLMYEEQEMTRRDYEAVEEMRGAVKAILENVEGEVSKMTRMSYTMQENRIFYRSAEPLQAAISEKRRELEEWEEICSILNNLLR